MNELSRRLEEILSQVRALGASSGVDQGSSPPVDRSEIQRLCALAAELSHAASMLGGAPVVAEQRRAERALLDERADMGDKLAKVGASVPGVILSFLRRPDGSESMPFATPQIEELYGISAAILAEDATPFFVNLPADEAERVQSGIADSFHAMSPWHDTFRYDHPTKGRRWIEGRSIPVKLPDGSVLWHGFVMDVTDQKASEERYRSLVENQDDIVYAVDLEGRITFISQAIRKLGFAPQDLIGATFLQSVHAQDLQALREGFASALGGRSVVVDHRVLDKEQRTWFIRASMRPTIQGDRVVGVQGVLTDLTRQHEAEEQLRMAQKMEAIGRLAGGVAHDFNNLLLVIMSYTELAMEALPTGDPIAQDLDEVRRASLRAAGLTRQLLAFSRKQVLRPEVIDLQQLTHGMEKMLRRLLGEDVELVFRPRSASPRVLADAGQIEQVLMNLAINGRDAMRDGGALLIDIHDVELRGDGAVTVVDAAPGLYVCVSISDTGCGMDDATQARAFEPFFTTKESGKGTGLGLSTVYGIVKQSGGYITLKSAPGQGTTFEIYLPQARSERRSEPARPGAVARAEGGTAVLLVEDEEVVRKLGQRVLTNGGYTALVARTGAEALKLSAERAAPIHLLVTDVVLPGMNGRELADRLTAQRPGIRVLYTSGYTYDVVAQRGALDPGSHFIAKPYLGEDLLRAIRDVLEPA